jgi:hypothetical protein
MFRASGPLSLSDAVASDPTANMLGVSPGAAVDRVAAYLNRLPVARTANELPLGGDGAFLSGQRRAQLRREHEHALLRLALQDERGGVGRRFLQACGQHAQGEAQNVLHPELLQQRGVLPEESLVRL